MPSILNIPDFDINRRKSSTNYCYGWSFQINLLGFAQKFKSGSHCCYVWSCLMHSLKHWLMPAPSGITPQNQYFPAIAERMAIHCHREIHLPRPERLPKGKARGQSQYEFQNVDVKDPFKWLCSIDSYLINWRSSSWLEKLSFVTSIHQHFERQPVAANEENRSAKLSECCPCPHTFTIYKLK